MPLVPTATGPPGQCVPSLHRLEKQKPTSPIHHSFTFDNPFNLHKYPHQSPLPLSPHPLLLSLRSSRSPWLYGMKKCIEGPGPKGRPAASADDALVLLLLRLVLVLQHAADRLVEDGLEALLLVGWWYMYVGVEAAGVRSISFSTKARTATSLHTSDTHPSTHPTPSTPTNETPRPYVPA